MTEWMNVAVCKTVRRNPHAGSNPASYSIKFSNYDH